MIGKAKEPACISGNILPIPYLQQKNAWIDVPTFNKWFHEVFEPYVRKRTGHKNVDLDNDNDETVDEIARLLSNCNLLNGNHKIDIHGEIEQCLIDDNDDDELFKNTLLEEIEQAMGAVIVQEFVIRSEDDEPKPTSVHNDIDHRDVILQSLEGAISLDVNMSDLKSLPYLLFDHLNQAKAALLW
ncbi:hypothetical protein AXG93_3014s1000 [Marchantia polymorpha subsp. ruderalis]|uniref:DDE-1 domain-containing protein n=1 Tax=Marchantia polymorpha subsp. ruderalis TaxID=1480154 RepID=A0A176VS59_MARPO|nr:hypothetical protein AXG93_3014s1000 [Marchantia polymorpha subsp. ruderalis]